MTTSAKTKQVYIRVGHYYLKTIGVHGALGGRSFAFPVDVAWDSRGRLYVASGDAGNPRITVLNLDEDYFGEFGSPSEGDRKIGTPTSIAIDSYDTLYISDRQAHCVSRYDTEGNSDRQVGRLWKRGRGVDSAQRPGFRRRGQALRQPTLATIEYRSSPARASS